MGRRVESPMKRRQRMVLVVPLALGMLSAASALAQQAPVVHSGIHVHLKVGEQKVLNVGMAMGRMCDDGTGVQAELHPASDTQNNLVLVGLKPGHTACRAGTANMSRSILVKVAVKADSQ